MIKPVLYLIAFVITINSSAQNPSLNHLVGPKAQIPSSNTPSKKETAEWIIGKIKTYACQDGRNAASYNGETGVFVLVDDLGTVVPGTRPIASVVILKDVISIEMQKRGNCYWVDIRARSNSIASGFFGEGQGLENKQYTDHVTIFCTHNFIDEDLPARFKKAFKQLVTYHGGTMNEAY